MKAIFGSTVMALFIATGSHGSSASKMSSRIMSATIRHEALLPGGTQLTLIEVASSNEASTYVPPRYQNDKKIHAGRRLFNKDWSVADKDRTVLGPKFDQTSCVACHTEISPSPSVLNQLSNDYVEPLRVAQPSNGKFIERFGIQFNIKSLDTTLPVRELAITYKTHDIHIGNGDKYMLRKPQFTPMEGGHSVPQTAMKIRTAPALFGWGLLAHVDASSLREMADEFDTNNDGISGRVSVVRTSTTGDSNSLGRFGWKAEISALEDQIAAALLHDMGITSSRVIPKVCQLKTLEGTKGCKTEISKENLDAITRYVMHLGVPERRNQLDSEVIRGERVFNQSECSSCHVPVLKTGEAAESAFSNQIIWPYSDLLLHDMGPDLADPRTINSTRQQDSARHEWRTSPLWGIGSLSRLNGHGFLHDGRAATLTEAILWHGGEARQSQQSFIDLDESDQHSLLRFLESL